MRSFVFSNVIVFRFSDKLLEGYRGIDPQNPGSADNGKDAIYFDDNNAIVFAFSIQKSWRKKFDSDFASVIRHNPDMKTLVFGSNQRLSPLVKDTIKAEKAAQGIKVDFYDAGRIKVLLDTHYKKIMNSANNFMYDCWITRN